MRFVPLNRVAPPIADVGGESRPNSDPRFHRCWIDFLRLLKILTCLLQAWFRPRPMIPSPSAHYEIARVGIDLSFLFDPPACYLHDLQTESPGEPTGDLVLSLREAGALGVEPIRP